MVDHGVCWANATIGSYIDLRSDYHIAFITTVALHVCLSVVFLVSKWLRKNMPSSESPLIDRSVSEICQARYRVLETSIFGYAYRFKSHSEPAYYSCDRKDSLDFNIQDIRTNTADHNSSSQESALDYRVGGYKPTRIGEDLGDYSVIRKLGFGNFSTVWLCNSKTAEDKYVAIKVVKSIDMCVSMAKEEIKLLNNIASVEADNLGRKHIIEMMDYFHVNSINGRHVCIAFELMGPSLLHLITQSQYQGIYEGAVKSITRQICIGLSYLHNKCEIIHTDLKPENILIKVNESYIKNMVDKATKYNEMGLPMPRSYVSAESYVKSAHVLPRTGSLRGTEVIDVDRLTRSTSFPRLEDLTNSDLEQRKTGTRKELYVSPKIEVKIADLGNACWQNDKIHGVIQTKQYRALEVLLESGFNFPADLWSVGCIAFELATGEFLFNPRNTPSYSSSEDHILLIYELLAGIPPYIASRGKKSKNYFTSEGELKLCETDQLHIWKAEDVLVEKYDWKRVDAIPFASMINAMVEPDPELRITAENALMHQWLNDSSS